jgi:hypothetical protein
MSVVKCDIPPSSVLDRGTIDAAYFKDSYRTPLVHPGLGVVDVFHAVFAHHPWWMKAVLVARNRMASIGGLDAPTASEIMKQQVKESYAVGDKIGVWPIYALSDSELIAGRDNKHLDFRLSVLKVAHDEKASVVISTVCNVHNTFGKFYLFFIVPFHKWGVQKLMRNAIAAGRL